MDDKIRNASRDPLPGPAPARRRRARWPWALGAVIVIILVIAFLTHRHSGAGAGHWRGGGNLAVLISTATAQKGDMGVYVEALGTVTPVDTVSVVARVPGQIVKVEYQEGQDVRVGDPLVEIDPRPYQAAVLQARGQLEHDQAMLSNAQLDLGRYKEAYESNAIPMQQYDTQVATVQQDQGSVELDEGNLSNALVNLDYCHITSPIEGRVGLRLVDPGNVVPANGPSPLVIITRMRPITVIFNVAEDDLPRVLAAVRENKELPMDIYDREDANKIGTGKLLTLDNQINPSTGTLRLRGICSNEDESLFPNQFVNVHLLVKTLRGVTLLPNPAIQRNSESAYVYLVKPPGDGQTNDTVQIQAVTTGMTDGTNTQVDGISPGDMVAADNFNRLSDGAKVILRSSGPSGAAAAKPGKEDGKVKRRGQGRRNSQ
ncbi:MAG: efflux RND transporter periplasmic adaptor subunit [Limisphaerales bacterium]